MFDSPLSWTIFAEGAATPGPLAGIVMLWPIVIMVFLYIVMVHRPQKREQALRQALLSNMKKNDHVLLNCGIFGVVTNVRPEADEVTIRVDDSSNTKLRVTRSAIARIITDEPATTSDAAAAEPSS